MYTKERLLGKFKTEKMPDTYQFWYELVDDLQEPVGECVYKDCGQRIYRNNNKIIRYIGAVNTDVRNAYLRIESNEKVNNVQILASVIREKITSKLVLNSLGIEQLVIRENGMIQHASFIKYQNKAILFTAPSGIGKSTQADLWKRLRGAEVINGDRAIIWYHTGKFWGCGLPFSGSSTYCENKILELGAVVYLGQAKTTEINRISGKKAFGRIWEGANIPLWNKESLGMAVDLVERMIREVPIYQLDCTPDKSAVEALENQLKWV